MWANNSLSEHLVLRTHDVFAIRGIREIDLQTTTETQDDDYKNCNPIAISGIVWDGEKFFPSFHDSSFRKLNVSKTTPLN